MRILLVEDDVKIASFIVKGLKAEGFAVDMASLQDKAELTHLNLNDKTVEGLRLKNEAVFSVQYHPEAGPGPHDSHYLFERFIEYMKGNT